MLNLLHSVKRRKKDKETRGQKLLREGQRLKKTED